MLPWLCREPITNAGLGQKVLCKAWLWNRPIKSRASACSPVRVMPTLRPGGTDHGPRDRGRLVQSYLGKKTGCCCFGSAAGAALSADSLVQRWPSKRSGWRLGRLLTDKRVQRMNEIRCGRKQLYTNLEAIMLAAEDAVHHPGL
jgi:hypothetical protein